MRSGGMSGRLRTVCRSLLKMYSGLVHSIQTSAARPSEPGGKPRPPLGRKGAETRARLLRATKDLLETTSPFDITVAAIVKATKSVPGTLYVYFKDVADVIYALSVEASEDFAKMLDRHGEWFNHKDMFLEDSYAFATEFCETWDRHKHVLHYQVLEADRGNRRFQELRTASALPVIKLFARVLRAEQPSMEKTDAQAEAVVLYCAVERVAATPSDFPADRPGPPQQELIKALARIIARHLGT